MCSYLPLFSISVEHEFFTQDKRPKMEFVSTHQTSMILKNCDLLTKKTINGLYVFYNSHRAESIQLYASEHDQGLNFVFKAFSHNPLFQNFTDPPSYRKDAVLYLDNRNVQEDKTGRLRLHEAEWVTEKNFTKVDSPFFESILGKEEVQTRPDCILDIRITKEECNLLVNPAKVECKNYYLTFRARETFWKYYLLGTLERKRPYIVDLDHKILFESGGRVSLTDNRSALSFRSKVPIPLQDRCDRRLQLREKRPEGEKVIIKRLPVASPDQISREIIGKKETMVSEIYINC